MDEARVLKIIRECGALLEGHFLLSSGLHSSNYLQCALVFQYPKAAEELCGALAEKWRDAACDTIMSPALGGIIFGYELARCLGVKNIFAERQDGEMMLRRGFELQRGERVLIAEDVVTTGKSVREIIRICEQAGAEILGVTALLDRSPGEPFPGRRFEALMRLQFPTYQPDDCPLCSEGKPLVKPGSRDVRRP